jgi:hypothetical protein
LYNVEDFLSPKSYRIMATNRAKCIHTRPCGGICAMCFQVCKCSHSFHFKGKLISSSASTCAEHPVHHEAEHLIKTQSTIWVKKRTALYTWLLQVIQVKSNTLKLYRGKERLLRFPNSHNSFPWPDLKSSSPETCLTGTYYTQTSPGTFRTSSYGARTEPADGKGG